MRVASKLDTESALLGAMILLTLEANGIGTVDKLQLGPTNILRSAIIAGEIDIYPEYTGNGALFYHDEQDPAWRDARAGYDKVRSLDLARHRLVWLTPAPADNRWVIAVPRAVAASIASRPWRDFAAWVQSAAMSGWPPRQSSSKARRRFRPSSGATSSASAPPVAGAGGRRHGRDAARGGRAHLRRRRRHGLCHRWRARRARHGRACRSAGRG